MHLFLDQPKPTPLMLGVDFLKEQRCVIDYGKDLIQFQMQSDCWWPLFGSPFWFKPFWLKHEVSVSFLVFLLLHPRQTSMGRRGWQATEVPQCWFNVIRGPRPPSVLWPNARQPDGVRPSAASPSVRPQFASRTMAPGTFKGEPRGPAGEREETSQRSRSSHRSTEVTTLRGSLAKAKRNAQEAPVVVQVNGARVCRSSSEAFGCSRRFEIGQGGGGVTPRSCEKTTSDSTLEGSATVDGQRLRIEFR